MFTLLYESMCSFRNIIEKGMKRFACSQRWPQILLKLEFTDPVEMSDCKHSAYTHLISLRKKARKLAFQVLFFPSKLIGEMSAEEAGLDSFSPRDWDYCETQPEAGMTSERPDFRLNSVFQVGRITSGFTRRWSCPVNQSHTVLHSSPQGLNADCLDRWTCVLSLNCHRATFFRLHIQCKVYVSPSQ